ncbi:HAD-IIIC family phosphatase [Ralstonia solanacearum species complex bacterium KE056]|uniref:HAD-IIIC family phosphatase n=1 Tax=Ralstonia solanacearum species complex bacterium KE056 TaxID=3119585 RepID=UPI002FC280E4
MSDIINLESVQQLGAQEKRALLAQLMKRKQRSLALSLTQERIWQLDQIRPGTPVYNFQSAVELNGPLDIALLNTAVNRVVARHETLRTAYGMADGEPRLSVVPVALPDLTVVDIGHLEGAALDAHLLQVSRTAAQGAFSLAEPPLFRIDLLRVGPDAHVIILTMHHIVSDVLSLDLFFADWGAEYGALVKSEPSALAPLTFTYQDHVARERAGTGSPAAEAARAHWRQHLHEPTAIEWNSDFPRPPSASGHAATLHFAIPAQTLAQTEALARAERCTPFMVLLAVFYIVQYAISRQRDQMVASPSAGRSRSDLAPLIGMFSSPVPMRVDVDEAAGFRSFLANVRSSVLGAAEHDHIPFSEMVELAQASGPLQAPLVRSMFSFVSRTQAVDFNGMPSRRVPTDRGISDFDLFLTLYRDDQCWRGLFEYNTDLFSPDTADSWARAYVAILEAVTRDAALPVAELAAKVPVPRRLQVGVAATFVTEPLGDYLPMWERVLRWPARIAFAPYNQVFQSLFDPSSVLYDPGNTINVLLLRPEDWVRSNTDAQARSTQMQRAAEDLVALIRDKAGQMRCPLCVCLCEPTPDASDIDEIRRVESILETGLAVLPNVITSRSDGLRQRYDIGTVFDADTDRIGHIPYTRDWFAAMSAELMRQASHRLRAPYKVLALDCDNTLWKGVCGEDGALGVSVTEPFAALQRFARRQAEAGMLLCLVSKNHVDDALAVFDTHPGMVLRRDAIVGHRINWLPKSENLRSLARELNLGLDSFIFIDDNPVECAEVRANCPEVLTLCLPEDPGTFQAFMDHVWAFDRSALSQEDRKRAQTYVQNRDRAELRAQSASFEDFLAKLELAVEIAAPAQADIERLAQLSQRTNQFNNAGVRHDELSLRRALDSGLQARAVRVRDRFGDYGLVGSILYRERPDLPTPTLRVESFLMSCRTLGRGVEHRMLAAMGEIAQRGGMQRVEIAYRSLPRNKPFRNFLDTLGGTFDVRPDETALLLGADQASLARHLPPTVETPTADDTAPAGTASALIQSQRAAGLAAIAASLRSAQAIQHKADQHRPRPVPARGEAAPAQDDTEQAIADIWETVLKTTGVSRHDNFFDIGGNSLLLVRVNSLLNKRLSRNVSITALFQFPTIASLAGHLGGGEREARQLDESRQRAQRARQQLQGHARRMASVRGR